MSGSTRYLSTWLKNKAFVQPGGILAEFAPGLREYYPLKEASGTTIVDRSGNSINGVYTSSGLTYQQNFGNAVLTGILQDSASVSSPLSIVSNGIDTTATTWAVSFWYKLTNTSEIGTLFTVSDNQAGGTAYFRLINIFGAWYFQNFSTNTYITVSTGIDTTTPHHVVVNYASGLFEFFIDNTSMGTLSSPQVLGTTHVCIGNDDNNSYPIDSYMAEFALWQGYTLTGTQITDLFNSGNGLSLLV